MRPGIGGERKPRPTGLLWAGGRLGEAFGVGEADGELAGEAAVESCASQAVVEGEKGTPGQLVARIGPGSCIVPSRVSFATRSKERLI